MKFVHLMSWFFVVVGGLHFALGGIGVDFMGSVFGTHMGMVSILAGLSILYHGVPVFTKHLSKL